MSSRRGGSRSWPSATASALRAMLPSALSVSPLFGDSVHMMRSVLIRTNRVLQSSERSLLLEGGGPSSQLRSHPKDPKRIRARSSRPLLPRHFRVLGAVPEVFTSSSLASLCALSSLFTLPLPPLPLGADGCCREDRRPLRSPTGGARAPQAFSLRPRPPVSWRSCLPERLSFLRDV